MTYWAEIVALAVKAGSSEDEIKDKVERGHTILWPVDEGLMLLDCATDGALVIWLCAGSNVRGWFRSAEIEVGRFAAKHGCNRLRIEGRRGWKRLLPHWTVIRDGDEVVLEYRLT